LNKSFNEISRVSQIELIFRNYLYYDKLILIRLFHFALHCAHVVKVYFIAFFSMLLLKDDGLLKIVPSWNFKNWYFINRRLFDFQNLVNTFARIEWCALGKFLLHMRTISRYCYYFFVLLFCINFATFLGSFLRRYSSNRSKCIKFWLCGIVQKNWDMLKFWINFHVTLFWLFLRNEL